MKNVDKEALCFTPALELRRMLRAGEVTSVQLVEALLERIERHEPSINAFVTLTGDTALEQARDADRRFATTDHGQLPPLLGLPVMVKDLTATAGVRTTYGSKNYADHIPDEDDAIWARLKAAGAILLGKTTTPEFGGHTATESLLTGITNNPWNRDRIVGGSSGGSAAALAAGFGPLATGSDGGGSIRVPSSMCGVVGLKPSIGRVPRGREALRFESVSAVGPMTRSVLDAALMLSVIAGPHSREPYSLPESETDYVEAVKNFSVEGIRIAVNPDLGNPPIQSEVEAAVREAGQVFRELGASVEDVDIELPDPMVYFETYWAPVMASELDSAQPDAFDPENTPLRIREFTNRVERMSAQQFARASLVIRSQIHEAFAEVFDGHDVLIFATTPTTAYPHPGPVGGPPVVVGKQVREPHLDNQRLTEAIAHAGYPAISIPGGFDREGLPIGLQIAGRHGTDDVVLGVAHAFEQARPWADRRPQLS